MRIRLPELALEYYHDIHSLLSKRLVAGQLTGQLKCRPFGLIAIGIQ